MPNLYALQNTRLFENAVESEGHLLERGVADIIHGFPGLKRTRTQVRNMRFGARYQNNLLRAPRNLGAGPDYPSPATPVPHGDMDPHRPPNPRAFKRGKANTPRLPALRAAQRHPDRPSLRVQRHLSSHLRALAGPRIGTRQAHSRISRVAGVRHFRSNPTLTNRLARQRRSGAVVRFPRQAPTTNMSRRAPRRATRAYGGSSSLLGGGVGSFATKRFAAAPLTVEVKYLDNDEENQGNVRSGVGVLNGMLHTAAAIDLSFIEQGTGQSERIGTDVHLKQLTLSYQPRADGAGTDADYSHWRVTVFLWKSSADVGVKPTWDDIFETARAVKLTPDDKGVALDTGFAMYNSKTAHTYKILSDKSGTLTGKIGVPVVGGSIAPLVKVACPLNVTCKLSDDAVYGSNKVWMLFSTYNHTTIADVPKMSFVSRLWYTDA